MKFFSGYIYHIYNQGNNREQLFYERENYLYFLRKINTLILPHAHILAWCLMPNHYHLLVRVKEEYGNDEVKRVGGLNRAVGTLQSSYAQAINKKLQRTGSLFRQKAKEKSLDVNSREHDDYLINCFLYIHQNPLRAGLVELLEDWEFSSYQDFAGVRNGQLCNTHLARDLIKFPSNASDFKDFSYQTIPVQFLNSL